MQVNEGVDVVCLCVCLFPGEISEIPHAVHPSFLLSVLVVVTPVSNKTADETEKRLVSRSLTEMWKVRSSGDVIEELDEARDQIRKVPRTSSSSTHGISSVLQNVSSSSRASSSCEPGAVTPESSPLVEGASWKQLPEEDRQWVASSISACERYAFWW